MSIRSRVVRILVFVAERPDGRSMAARRRWLAGFSRNPRITRILVRVLEPWPAEIVICCKGLDSDDCHASALLGCRCAVGTIKMLNQIAQRSS
jgi:hypothetical protein